MINCLNCNNQVPEGTKFCPSCGAQMPEPTQNDVPRGSQYSVEGNVPQGGVQSVPPYQSSNSDAENNKAMGVLSYLGILCLIPIFGAKDSHFARFHANQGLPLAILGIGYPILRRLLSLLFYEISFSLGLTMGGIMRIIGAAVSVFVFVMSIIGIVNACHGEEKELPVTGKIKILK